MTSQWNQQHSPSTPPSPTSSKSSSSPPHRVLSVSKMFRTETLRLRPRAFAMAEKTAETSNKPSSSSDNDGKDAREKSIAPAQIDLDFSCDLLVLPWDLYHSPKDRISPSGFKESINVPELEKLDIVAISWAKWSWVAATEVAFKVSEMKNIKLMVLINQGDLEESQSLCRYTSVGPFERKYGAVREWVEGQLAKYHRWLGLAEPLKVVSLRLTSQRGENLDTLRGLYGPAAGK